MERLTESENKYYGDQQHIRQMCYMGFDGTCKYPACNGCQILKMYRELAAYQDTGLTPQEIMDGKLLTGWIPVNEAQPPKPEKFNESVSYLVVVNAPHPKTVEMQYERVVVRRQEKCRWKWNERISPWEPTHWMPLPLPPGESENE